MNLQVIPTAMLWVALGAPSLTAQVPAAGCHPPLPSPGQAQERICRDPSWPVERTNLVNWAIQSSASVAQTGDVISLPGYDAHTWYPASVPTTVLNAQVSDGILPDPAYDINMQSLPGALYDPTTNFIEYPQPPDNPYLVSWWYRTEVSLPRQLAGERLWLNFDSINYRANIWLNGKLIADSSTVAGMYRGFEFDVSGFVAPGVNALAVEVIPPLYTDLTLNFVDWNPMPPDNDMGIVQSAYLLSSGPVSLRNPQVVSTLNATLDQAQFTLYADLTNDTGAVVNGTLSGTVGDISFSTDVQLATNTTTRISLTPQEFPQLAMANPQLWWTADLGAQPLYQMQMQFTIGGAVSDIGSVTFGIRQISSQLDENQHRLFYLNGRRLLIRGAAWTHDIMLRQDPEREEYQVRYAAAMHLNALRLEGKMFDTNLYTLADRYGVLIMPGWCVGVFEEDTPWTGDQFFIAQESMRYQMRQLRNHPSVFVFLYGSDNAPPPDAEEMYLQVIAEENWPNPYLNSASNNTTPGTGPAGFKMTGPYDWVSPNYWLTDTQRGGAFGFITETSPGPAVPLLASLQQMMASQNLWPVGDSVWNFHAGAGDFAQTNDFTSALRQRYGAAKDTNDYVMKSQLMTYEAERAMFEAYGRNKYTSTGIIQWLMNTAWPGLIWHLYDYYLRPGGGFFGTMKALEPVHVQYSYDDSSIVVVNSLYQDFYGYSVTAEIYNIDGTQIFSQTMPVTIPQDSSTRVFNLPHNDGFSPTYFVRLLLNDDAGGLVSSNFYWLSTQSDIIDWSGPQYPYTPLQQYADFTGLQDLPPAEVTSTWTSVPGDPDQVDTVTVRNESKNLAFFVHLTVLQGQGGPDVAPVYWSDNYFPLMPGESRTLTATYPAKLLNGAASYVQVDGWNVVAK
jgi:exo-1,4-beta-D-glucosaminidase